MDSRAVAKYRKLSLGAGLFLASVVGQGQRGLAPPDTSTQRIEPNNAPPLQQALRNLQNPDGPPRYRRAFKLLTALSDAGSADAMGWLGSLYLYGRGTPADVPRALKLIQSSASQNSAVGLRFLGLLYLEGDGLPQDYNKAISYFDEAITSGDAPSCGRLGMLYLTGAGLAPDHAKGEELLKRGALLGDSWSMVELGRLYATDNIEGDKVLALEQYRAGAARGNRLAAFRAGIFYELGQGSAKSPALAFSYYMQAAKQWHAGAQLALCRFYHEGLSIKRDDVRALSYCNLAADQGMVDASVYAASLQSALTRDQLAQSDSIKYALRNTAFPSAEVEATQ